MFKLVGRTIGPAQPAFWRPESSPVAGCRFRDTHVRILPSYMEAGCTVSGTAKCWTIGSKLHAAAGRKFVVLMHVALEHLADPFPP